MGHGALGRLIARVTEARYQITPTVWETAPERREGDFDYPVLDPAEDERRDYRQICDVSGTATIIDQAVHHLAKHATVLLAGFYAAPIKFNFPAAFMAAQCLYIRPLSNHQLSRRNGHKSGYLCDAAIPVQRLSARVSGRSANA